MNDIEKIKRHLGRPIPITLRNEDGVEDVLYFKPMTVGQEAILGEIVNDAKGKETILVNGKKIPKVGKKESDEMFNLVLDICNNSFPDLDKNTLLSFTNRNFNQITLQFGRLLGENINKKEVDLIKQARENRKNAK